jgi:histidinol phosphatase-like PHP family hydrolase/calcineurin-like phosphoesterase family protein
MSTKIAVFTDFHFSSVKPVLSERKGELADILLLRAVHRLNRFIKPDLVFFGGDMLDEPDPIKAPALMKQLRTILNLLEAPYIIIPGNHDPSPEIFYGVFPEPAKYTDINGIRFIAMTDKNEPGYNARRLQPQLDIMREAGDNFNGPLISLQHVPLLPPGTSCPYNYTNNLEILDIMRENNFILSISGHFHKGMNPREWNGISMATVASVSERPFPYTIIEIENNNRINFSEERLGIPERLKLSDSHIHTKLAYCNENMSIPKVSELLELFGLHRGVISEHSAHLYFNATEYGNGRYFTEGLSSFFLEDRTEEYFNLYKAEFSEKCRLGMEIDIDMSGNPVIKPETKELLSFRNGALHMMKTFQEGETSEEKITDEFMFLTESLLKSGIDSLAHPFRIFRRHGKPVPENIFGKLVKLLKKYNTAAEINFHTNEPPADFFRLCIENGVPLSFGSDSHNLYETGEFYPHLKMLESIIPEGSFDNTLMLQIP